MCREIERTMDARDVEQAAKLGFVMCYWFQNHSDVKITSVQPDISH